MMRTPEKKKLLLQALEKTLGVVSRACKAANVDYTTFYNWHKTDPKFAEQADYIRNELSVDFAESSLYQKIKEGDTTAIIFFLKTRGKARGYTEKQEATVSLQDKFLELMMQVPDDE